MIPGLNLLDRRRIPWWFWILGVDLFLVAITVLKKYDVVYPGKHWLGRHFNLAVEMNAAVWWSGVCLLAVAFLAYELSCRNAGRMRFAWLSLSVMLACFSLDEVGSIHERVGAWSNLLPFGTVFFLVAAYALNVLFRKAETRVAAGFIAGGFLLFGTVAFLEFLGDALVWPTWAIGVRTGMEEGSELLGVLFLLRGVRRQQPGKTSPSLRAIIPEPFAMSNLTAIVLGGWIMHSVASLLVPSLVDTSKQGNPLSWYPVVIYFLLSLVSFWRWQTVPAEKPNPWAFLCFIFLLASVGSNYDPPRLLPVVGGLVQKEYLPSLFFFSLVSVVVPLLSTIRRSSAFKCRYLPVLLIPPIVSLFDRSIETQFFLAGLLAFLIFEVFWGHGVMDATWDGIVI